MLLLSAQGISDFRLKQAQTEDCEDLRLWKNANRQFFFFKEEITPEMQAKWFTKLQANKNDMMLMAQEFNGTAFVNVGCMGYRLLKDENVVDVYNIMRGQRLKNSSHSMAGAFNLMNVFLHTTVKLPITCKVLAGNPARQWYEKNGFEKQAEVDDHIVYRLNPAKLNPVQVEITNL